MPRHTFKPGQSGNPNGRPLVGLTLAEAVRREVDPVEWVKLAWKRAKAGSDQALGMLADRGWGKAPIEVMLRATTQRYDLERLTNEELALFELLVEKMDAKRLTDTIVDADSVDAV